MNNLIILITVLLLFACNKKQKPNAVNQTTDEYAVINLAIKQITLPDSIYKQSLTNDNKVTFYPPTQSKKQTAAVKRKQKIYADSLQGAIDSAKIYLFVNDSLIRFPVDEIRKVYKTKNAPLANAGDTVKLIRQILLSIDTNTRAGKLDHSAIYPLYNYQLVFYHGRSPRNARQLSPGEISVSWPCFDKEKTVACIYAVTYTGPLNAAGYIIYFVKKKDKWVILRSVNTWVA